MSKLQSMAGLGAHAQCPSMAFAGLVDIHHHILPPVYVQHMAKLGVDHLAGQLIPIWQPSMALEQMDVSGIATAMTSIPCLDLPGLSAADTCVLARSCNEYSAELAGEHPGRFGSFACIPQADIAQACSEAIHALDVLKADGVVLLASSAGRFLGDSFFEPLMAELDRRQARVFVHGNVHPTSPTLGLSAPEFLLEVPCDLTRAALNLVISGTLERYSGIRWILANAGGFLPYVTWRVSLANAMTEFSENAPQGIVHYLQRFYYDVAQASTPYAVAALRELVKPSQLLFGTDVPFASVHQLEVQQRDLAGLPQSWQVAVRRSSALSLFPRFANSSEAVVPLQSQEPELPFDRLFRQATRPLRELLEQLRK